MHTVDLLEQALAKAEGLGYRVRLEWLGGCRGGDCEIAGQKWLLLDVSLSPAEQLEIVTDFLNRVAAATYGEARTPTTAVPRSGRKIA